MGQAFGAQLEQVLHWLARDYQRVARALRHHVHERHAVLLVEHHMRVRLAAQDPREDVVGVVGHRRLAR